MHKPIISTFVNNKDQAIRVMEAGAECILLDDPKYSIRYIKNTAPSKYTNDHDRLQNIIDGVREKYSNCEIVFNTDRVIHNEDLKTFHNTAEFFCKNNVNTFRIMDTGLVNLVCREYPNVKIQLNTETGNNNYKSFMFWINSLGDHLDKIVLSKELDIESITDILAKTSASAELQVHGNIMLLYTRRRVLESLDLPKNEDGSTLAFLQEKTRNEESYPIVDNVHGSYMLHSKKLCLIEDLPLIMDSTLALIRSIMIDLRGTDTDQLCDTVRVYKSAMDSTLDTGGFDANHFKSILPRFESDFTKGFFNRNTTDKAAKSKSNYSIDNIDKNNSESFSGISKDKNDGIHTNDTQNKTNLQKIGEVCDVVKENSMVLDIETDNINLHLGDTIIIDTPEGNVINLKVTWIKNLLQDNLDKISSKGFYIIKWAKGSVRKSNVYVKL